MTGTEREQELLERIARLEEALEASQRDALTCPLTCALNRRGWEGALAREEGRCKRHGLDAVIVAMDLDGFKQVNAVGGHHAGDAVLCRCAEALQAATRGHDVVARCGGDEFSVLAVATTPAAAEPVMSRLATALAAVDIRASMGGATFSECGNLVDAWRAADRKMMQRKSSRATGGAA